MGMMTKMRDNAHIFIITFVVVFVAFWVISDIDIQSIVAGSQNEIGDIEGRSVTLQEYQKAVDQAVKAKQDENQGKELDNNAVLSIREQVWEQYVSMAILQQACDELGLSVSDGEVEAAVHSQYPPRAIAQYFVDSTGFNQERYQAFLASPGAENREILVQIEDNIRNELLQEKMMMILGASVQLTEQDLRDKYTNEAVQLSASYVMFNPGMIAAKDTGKPTDEEYQAFYEKNKRRFKTEETRKIAYVLFPFVPSKSDTLFVRDNLLALAEEARGGKDFLELVKTSSEVPYSETTWYTHANMAPQVADSLFRAPAGAIVGPIASEAGYSLYKVIESRQGAKTYHEVSQIFYPTFSGQDEATQRAKAEKALRDIRGGAAFTSVAAANTEDPAGPDRKGYMGWMESTGSPYGPDFDKAVAGASIGQPVGPIKSQYGFHVLRVSNRSASELKYAEIRQSVKLGSKARDAIQEQASKFSYFATERGFEQEAKLDKYRVEESMEFSQGPNSIIPGIGSNPALLKFCFENKVGSISDVFEGSNGFVVVKLTGSHPKGYKTVDEVKDQIRDEVIQERHMRKTLQYARSIAKPGRSLAEIAASAPGLMVTPTGLFPAGGAPAGVGRDDAFVGTLFSLKPGQISKPFRGTMGVYVVQLESVTPFNDAEYKVKRDQVRQQYAEQLRNEFPNDWWKGIRETLSITDNRDRWYR
jgi:parvulin-like peptidyl-prolyl isomerase